MAKVITDKLHDQISTILNSLMENAPKDQRGKLAKIYGEFSEADTPKGYED